MDTAAPPQVPQCRYCNESCGLVAAVVSRMLGPGFTMTVVVKASFRLVPGEPLLPLDEQPPFRGEEYRDGAFGGELLHGMDLAAWKPRADLLLSGACHAPGGQAVGMAVAGFAVGDWEKTLAVFGDRSWRRGLLSSRPGEPQAFVRMPLDWAHAYGGAAFEANPAGKGYRDERPPNLEYPDRLLARPGEKLPPAAFGPVNRLWPWRHRKQGRYDAKRIHEQLPGFPPDIDWSYCNDAPADQQLDGYLRGDEQLRFRNLHPQHPEWTTALPGYRMRCLVEDRDEEGALRVREVELRLDTLHADTEAGVLELIWRGVVPVRSEDRGEVSAILVIQEALADPPRSFDDLLALKAEARDFAQKSQDAAQARIDAGLADARRVLERYGLSAAQAAVATQLPGAEEFACFPFAANGPLPARFAELEQRVEEAQARFDEALAEGRTLAAEQGVDLDAELAKPKSAAPLEQLQKGLDEAQRLAEEGGEELPDATRAVQERMAANPKDPFGVADMLQRLQGAGVDLARVGASYAALASSGDFGAFLAAGNPGLAPAAPEAADAVGTAATPPPPPPLAPKPADLAATAAPAADPSGLAAEADSEILVEDRSEGAPDAEASSAAAPASSSSASQQQAISDQAAASAAAATVPFLARLGRYRPEIPGKTALQAQLASGASLTGKLLGGADFSGLDLRGRDFSGALLGGADFREARLDGAIFVGALLHDADFRGARGAGVRFERSDLTRARLEGAELADSVFIETALTDARGAGAILRGTQWRSVTAQRLDLRGADFSGSVLADSLLCVSQLGELRAEGCAWSKVLLSDCDAEAADFRGGALEECILMGCRARGIRFGGARVPRLRVLHGSDLRLAEFPEAQADDSTWLYCELGGAEFSRASLRRSAFMDARCAGARFVSADLREGNLRRSDFSAADFSAANLYRATFGCADARGAVFRSANCYQADFMDCAVGGAIFAEAVLQGSNLRAG